MGVYIGVDVGTSGTKSLLLCPERGILAEATAEYPLLMPKPMWTEQDPDAWWDATKTTIRSVVRKSKVKASEVKAIGLSGQMHGSVFLDKKMHVIRPALLWNDQRTAAECDEIETRAGGRSKLIKMVANPALTGFTAPKILWLRNHEPKRFEKLAHVLLPKDDVRRRLTGELATDASDASGMLLLDVAKRKWSKKLLACLELDESLFAPVYESEEVTGTLLPDVASELGLSPDCQVIAGAGDCAAGAVGNGIVKKGILTASLGTSGVVFGHSETPEFDSKGRLHTFCHAVRGKWHMMGVTLSAAGSYQWLANQVLNQIRASNGPISFAQLNEAAESVARGSEGLFFLPYLAGERTPHSDPNARGCFIGLTNKHGAGHMARAVMEGVAYSLNESIAIMRELNVDIKQIRLSGGGAKSLLWKQILADVFDADVCTINAEQGPAYGVALLACVAGGEFNSIESACQSLIRVVEKQKKSSKSAKYYANAFETYQALYPALREAFGRIAAL